MPLTDNQCEKLHEAILDLYPYEQKDALESLLSEKHNINLEYILAYSDIITKDKLSKNIHTNNNQQIKEKIKILILKIPAKDLNLDKEIYELKKAIRESKNRDLLSIRDETVYSTDDIRYYVGNENPQIVHFCGHGLTDGSLKLENNSSSGISLEFLKSIFQGRENNIKCVLLNACHSEKATLAISQHINYVIGMNNEIIDNVAIEFAKGFYDGLGYNNDNNAYLMAFNEGIRAIIAKNISQKSIPVLRRRISYKEAILNLIKKLDAENKIEEFINELKNINPTNVLLYNFISYYNHPLKNELNTFREIIQKITDDSAIQAAYKKIFPDDIKSDKNKIIDKLIGNDVNNSEIISIIKFANHLTAILKIKNKSKSEEIQDWLDTICNEFKVGVIDSDEDEFSSGKIYTYLLITVDDQGSDKFNLYAEYILEDENSTIIKQEALNLLDHNEQNGIRCNSFNQISNQVKKYHDQLYNQLSPNELKDIRIELFLPIQYLTQNLDKEWYCDDDFGGSTPIVRECNIIVRPGNRIQKKNFLIPLHNNFERFKKQLSQYSDEDILNEEIEIINQKVDQKNFQKISDNFKDKKIGIKLTHKDIPDIAFFQAMIRGAAAIAFWIKDASCNDKNFDDMDNYLKLHFFQNNFCNLIKEIHNDRKTASNDEQIYSIGFLCDNPYRVPHIKPLQSF
ncbi:hypothetical protein IQ247_24955 [Plectonema cf. radiosum LEGE 06105]|uniref:vWA-MoxR associated protein C-terminal domain-containing protein n=1 Tax=Plectonema cf. radiosum LEGE 06105 TaxID=945769 RepID=A0A8J7F3X5_9CYAN|nr:hypothetical protein [Plectonema radiosum]MBE9215871.1 hypothetical protein [Plectonema cf. radiosum LEGE 06105]